MLLELSASFGPNLIVYLCLDVFILSIRLTSWLDQAGSQSADRIANPLAFFQGLSEEEQFGASSRHAT